VQINYLESNTDLALIGSGTYIINEDSAFVKYGNYPADKNLNSLILDGCYICHPTVMLRRDVLDDIGYYSTECEHAEDYELWLRISKKYKIMNAAEKLLIYRQHSNNISFRRYPEQLLLTFILQEYYKQNITLDQFRFRASFDLLEQVTTKERFSQILNSWRNDVNSMMSTGRLRDIDIPDYLKINLK
jgi:hypothetical protein